MKLTDKSSYLKGLMDGLDIDRTTPEGKIIVKMSEIIEDLSKTVEVLQTRIDDLTELCDDLDRDLGEVEEDLYYCDDDDWDDDDWDEDDYDDADWHSSDYDDKYQGDVLTQSIGDDTISDVEAEDDDELYEVECPTCHNTIVLDDSALDEGTMECPTCGEVLEFDFNDITIEDIESDADQTDAK